MRRTAAAHARGFCVCSRHPIVMRGRNFAGEVRLLRRAVRRQARTAARFRPATANLLIVLSAGWWREAEPAADQHGGVQPYSTGGPLVGAGVKAQIDLVVRDV